MVVREEKALYEFEKRYVATLDSLLPYADAVRVYEELWLRGRECGAISELDLLQGIEADIEMARTLNALHSP